MREARDKGMGQHGQDRQTCLFPGSFDPFTRGHADIVSRALGMFRHVIIAVGFNERKAGWIPVGERVRAIAGLYEGDGRVSVESYSCLTASLALDRGACCIVRGVRSMADYEYELQMADVARHLSGIDTIFIPANPMLSCVSSSMVRELAHFGRDVREFLPEGIRYDTIYYKDKIQ
ncbi:pantetheine-phosphate adenylyltransferase [bacterium]|nr:pantetheine-phosphate adenylyltransferase [bacterium]